MPRVFSCAALILSLTLAGAACSREDNGQGTRVKDTNPIAQKDQIEVTGCLTANKETGQFVLTANTNALTSAANRAAAGEAETFSYQLMGGTNLPEYLGREVLVKGVVEGKGQDVNIESTSKTETPAVKSRGEEVTPAIEVTEEIEMQVERLRVASINPTGGRCR